MRKKQEIEDPTSCLNTAEDDEPLFVLKGRDPTGGDTVRDWVRRRIECGCNKPDDQKIKTALEVADNFDNWPKKKFPGAGGIVGEQTPFEQAAGELPRNLTTEFQGLPTPEAMEEYRNYCSTLDYDLDELYGSLAENPVMSLKLAMDIAGDLGAVDTDSINQIWRRVVLFLSTAYLKGYAPEFGKDPERTQARQVAEAQGLFWLPCPVCGKWYGGHEYRAVKLGHAVTIDNNVGVGTCGDEGCQKATRLLHELFPKGLAFGLDVPNVGP